MRRRPPSCGELRACGIRTALDDFGTGYSSLAYVQRLPLDIIKIDKEFVQSVDEPRSQALANTIVNMARNLGLRTVAEGIETESQAMELARLGCEFAQGYLFFKPLSAVAMTALSEFENQPADLAEAVQKRRKEHLAESALDLSPKRSPAPSPSQSWCRHSRLRRLEQPAANVDAAADRATACRRRTPRT